MHGEALGPSEKGRCPTMLNWLRLGHAMYYNHKGVYTQGIDQVAINNGAFLYFHYFTHVILVKDLCWMLSYI